MSYKSDNMTICYAFGALLLQTYSKKNDYKLFTGIMGKARCSDDDKYLYLSSSGLYQICSFFIKKVLWFTTNTCCNPHETL